MPSNSQPKCLVCGGTGEAPHANEARDTHPNKITEDVLAIIDTERSRYKVAVAVTEYIARIKAGDK